MCFVEYDAHVYTWHNAPLRQKKDHCRIQIKKLQEELNSTNKRSADEYYWIKDRIRHLVAAISDMSDRQYDPMGVWYGRQSN